MGKGNPDESDNPPAAHPGYLGSETLASPAAPLVILAIDDDPGMLRFYEVALAR